MPREHSSRREVLESISSIASMADLLSTHEGNYDYELDLEVIVYGRNYGGKKVGPYVRLLTYEPGETVIREGDWGGNTFYVVVDGRADVFVNVSGQGNVKVAELQSGTQFGEMSVLAGVPRNATVSAPSDGPTQILEIQRPALRLLRKLSRFSEALDRTYRSHGKKAILEELKTRGALSQELVDHLVAQSQFRVFSRNHVLFRENGRIDRIYLIKTGWLHRTRGRDGAASAEARGDFLGAGYCFGLHGATQDQTWPYTVTLLGRSEILEISITRLRQMPELQEAVQRVLSGYGPPDFPGEIARQEPIVSEATLAAQEKLITTGLVDATNLLVMDMDLCVRCGNCSLACHKIHGQSRLARRGIHLARLRALKRGAVQSVLSPEVCMHCKDPECLTGCPTGAIGRFGEGHIDINPRTCIGCGDCATQCPYNAITMAPRKQSSAGNGGAAGRLHDLLRLSPDPLPAPVEGTDDLLAVKCNLCEGTSLNPEGEARPAYGCEESCPTGALARINPKQYFTEIGQIEGMAFLDQTHAVGRNIHRSDPPRRLIHVAGLALLLAVTGAAIVGLQKYGLAGSIAGFLNMRWITGIVGLAGIAGVMTYPVRRHIYRRRAGPLRYWMLVHSYLGVLAGVMLLLHGGTDSGGLLTTILMVTFDLVIVTGILGILLYLIVPRMLTRIEGEPLLLDDLLSRREELRRELVDIAGSSSDSLRALVKKKVVKRFLSFRYLLRQYLRRESLDVLLEAGRAELGPAAAGLSSEADRKTLGRAGEAAVTLRRVDSLIFLHRLLKIWLPPHVAFTSLMIALMVVHIIQVIYFA